MKFSATASVVYWLLCLPRARYIVVSKPKTMTLVSVASPLSTQHKGERAKTGWLWIRIMFQSGATCLLIDCCFSELALYKSSYAYCYSTNRTSSTSHWKLTYSRPISINSFIQFILIISQVALTLEVTIIGV